MEELMQVHCEADQCRLKALPPTAVRVALIFDDYSNSWRWFPTCGAHEQHPDAATYSMERESNG